MAWAWKLFSVSLFQETSRITLCLTEQGKNLTFLLRENLLLKTRDEKAKAKQSLLFNLLDQLRKSLSKNLGEDWKRGEGKCSQGGLRGCTRQGSLGGVLGGHQEKKSSGELKMQTSVEARQGTSGYELDLLKGSWAPSLVCGASRTAAQIVLPFGTLGSPNRNPTKCLP